MSRGILIPSAPVGFGNRGEDDGRRLHLRLSSAGDRGGGRNPPRFPTCYDCYFNEYIAHIAARKPDIVLVSSHQRSERADILEMQVKNIAFNTNAFVLRASVAMGEGRDGGCSMVAGPDGRILAGFGQQIGMLSCEIGDPHRKYMRSNSFGGAMIPNDRFVEQGRTPWSYRACGSAVIPGDDKLPYPARLRAPRLQRDCAGELAAGIRSGDRTRRDGD